MGSLRERRNLKSAQSDRNPTDSGAPIVLGCWVWVYMFVLSFHVIVKPIINWALSNSLNPYNRHSDWHKLGSLCYTYWFLNCDLFDFCDERTHHNALKTENRVLTTQQFCGNAIFVGASTAQSDPHFSSGILSEKSEKSNKSQFRLNMASYHGNHRNQTKSEFRPAMLRPGTWKLKIILDKNPRLLYT